MSFVIQVPCTINGRLMEPGETISAAAVGEGARAMLAMQMIAAAPLPQPVSPPAPSQGQQRRG